MGRPAILKEQIHIYTDGSSLGNPGPGGYGVVLKFKHLRKELSQGYRLTTNNRMELLAVIVALESLNTQAKDKAVVVHTDSKYVLDAVEKSWIYHWQRIQFKNKKNPDLWRRFLKIYPRYEVQFVWIKGHSGDRENERCDVLAKEAARKDNLLEDSGYLSAQQNLI